MAAVAGSVLLGKYRVERILGEGGFGYVVAATHLHLAERVAIKFLHPHMATDATIVTRFVHEAQAAARLKSHHVTRVSDIGTLPDGTPYIVMEYLEGENLGSLVERLGHLPAPTAATYLLEACEAIAEAHAQGIVHRDLKPGNLFLARGPGTAPIVKVLDFGISKITTGTDVSLTRTSAVLGSPTYAAPEQLRSTRHADARSDIWSLGVTLYHLLSGAVPFPGETVSEVCMKVAVDPVPPLPKALGVPRALEAVINKCMEKDPRDRYPDIVAFAKALAPFAGRAGEASLDRAIDALAGSASVREASSRYQIGKQASTITGSVGELQRAQQRKSRHRVAIAVGSVALLALVAVVAVVAGGGQSAESPPSKPAVTQGNAAAPASPTALSVPAAQRGAPVKPAAPAPAAVAQPGSPAKTPAPPSAPPAAPAPAAPAAKAPPPEVTAGHTSSPAQAPDAGAAQPAAPVATAAPKAEPKAPTRPSSRKMRRPAAKTPAPRPKPKRVKTVDPFAE